MKRSLFFSLIVSLVFTQACVKDEDYIFEGSSAERIAAALAEYKDVLAGAPNGWVMEYYPEEDYGIGGYTFICKFDDAGNVTVASEIADVDYQTTSLYKLISDQGPVLSFDTYNDIFHYFSTPSGSDVDAYSSDYEFVMTSVSSGYIEMTGKKYGNKVVMTPLDEQQDWANYLQQVVDVSDASAFGTYRFVVSNEEISSVVQTDRTFTFTLNDGSSVSTSFIYTTTGIKFHEPLTIGGVTVQYFDWDATTNTFVCSDQGVTASIVVNLPDDYLYYSDYIGNWLMSGSPSAFTTTLTIVQETKNKTLRVKGLAFDFLMTYNRANGTVSITSQQVGTYNGNYVYLAPWNTSAGYLTIGSGVGMNSVWNGSKDNFILSFADNGVWVTYSVNGFLFWQWTTAGASAGGYTVANYRFYNFKMTKQQ
ncbi:MAG: DUF4302 domain-containing protein [Breznakibacter sp.]